MENEVVWLIAPWSTYAFMIERGAFFSLVEIPGEGRILVENNDFEDWGERAIEYESDE
jgi:hypothetical protein